MAGRKGEKMSGNWATNLDMLAQEGIINFDGPAYVMGQKPRYVGNPQMARPFNGPAPEAPLINNQPGADEFKPSDANNKNYVKNPTWKKWLFGAVAVGTLIFGGYKFKKSFVPLVKKTYQNFTFKNACKSVGDFFKDGWHKFTGLFKKKKP